MGAGLGLILPAVTHIAPILVALATEPLQRARHEYQRGRSRVVGSGGAGSRTTRPR
jgi:hypothetical protein